MQLLTLKYRPRKLEDLVGQRHIKLLLGRILARRGEIAMPRAMILSGQRGTGKTTTARIIGASLNCTDPTSNPCGTCASCVDIFESRATAVLEINSATNGLVENIRDILSAIRYASNQYQVVIFDESQALSKAGFNAMLKPLEEGAGDTMFIFVTTEPDRIPVTIQSRSIAFEFAHITRQDIETRLRVILVQEEIPFEDAAIAQITIDAGGALRDAIMLVEQLYHGFGAITLENYHLTFGEDLDDVIFNLVNAIHEFDITTIDTVIDGVLSRLADPNTAIDRWIDFEVNLLNGSKYRDRLQSTEQDVLARLETLWFLADKVRHFGTARSLIRAAAVLMSARVTKRLLSTDEAFGLLAM